ncbi:hypothetical protein SAMN04489712_115100 [Thermomonospora echinospora]|uniref:Uncharacterized protein n=1 Tax=Thermomonospora echinospora TaxID=1992 RepID=A0A1H6DE91_9ACTN|nr:hypothetical protein [Thermomonospora echinospora]SEG82876.1 hypothetical protein SAMN04489712_115100 [Thermomonospora echinospora]
MTGEHGFEPLDSWWLHVPRLSNAFQLQCFADDAVRRLWWGNQVVGAIERHPVAGERWFSLGRDGLRLIPEPDVEPNGLYADPEAALLHARDAWRARDATVYDALGLDYWVEPRFRRGRGVESLWLGRTHLGLIQPAPGGTWSAFPTEDAPAASEGAITDAAEVTRDGTYPTRHAALRAVQHTWRAHLHRILGVRP